MENSNTKFRPILFSTPMVQAILENRKTMTRRVVKLPNYHPSLPEKQINKLEIIDWVLYDGNKERIGTIKCPYNIGDVLWVRETFTEVPGIKFLYKANPEHQSMKWKPSIFMPKEACRIFLRIKSIRVERLQDISREESRSEGIELDLVSVTKFKDYINKSTTYNEKISFYSLWEMINGKKSLESNPFVFVYEFEQIEKPLDFK